MSALLLRLRGRDAERGAAAVLVAALLASGVLAGLAAVGVDLGQAYSARRQVQNATDAAAMAATRQLDRARFTGAVDPVAAAAVSTTAAAVATANGADPASVGCTVVTRTGSTVAPCAPAAGWVASPAAVGVRVSALQTKATIFGGAVGQRSVTAGAQATAQVRAVNDLESAFMMCAAGSTDPRSNGDGPAVGLLLPGTDLVSPAAIGLTYTLHAPQVPRCGIGNNAFKGLADPSNSTVPGEWLTERGVRAGPTRAYIAGECGDADVVGCVIVVPLCYAGPASSLSGGSTTLYCAAYGAFRITEATANTHVGVFLGSPVVTGGTGTGPPTSGSARVVRLTD